MEEVEKVALADLQKGDKLLVDTLLGNFEITITGKRKKGSLLLVSVIYKTGEEKAFYVYGERSIRVEEVEEIEKKDEK